MWNRLPIELSTILGDYLTVKELESWSYCSKECYSWVTHYWIHHSNDHWENRYNYLDKMKPVYCIYCKSQYSHKSEALFNSCDDCFELEFDSLIAIKDDDCCIL